MRSRVSRPVMQARNAEFRNVGLPPAYQCCIDRSCMVQLKYLGDVDSYHKEAVVRPASWTGAFRDAGTESPVALLRALLMRLEDQCGTPPNTLVIGERVCRQIYETVRGHVRVRGTDAHSEYLSNELSIWRLFAVDDSVWNSDDIAIAALLPYAPAEPFASVEVQPLGGRGYGDICEGCNEPFRSRAVPGDACAGMLIRDFPSFEGCHGLLGDDPARC